MSERKSVKVGSITAGKQPSAAELAALQREGFRSVVNVRQVRESSQGLSPSQERRLALDLGLAFVHLPVSAENLSEKDVRAFQDAQAEDKGIAISPRVREFVDRCVESRKAKR